MPIGIIMNETERIRARVLSLMKKRGVKTVLELAEETGVSQSVLSRLLGRTRKREAKRPSHATISKLERYFNEPISDPTRMPQPAGLDDFLKAYSEKRKIQLDEVDAMRRVGAPPGRIISEDYWYGLLLLIRATEKESES